MQEKYPNRIVGSTTKKPFYIKKKEAYNSDWISEWDRVLEMRKEKHPLIKGGNFKKIPVTDIINERVIEKT